MHHITLRSMPHEDRKQTEKTGQTPAVETRLSCNGLRLPLDCALRHESTAGLVRFCDSSRSKWKAHTNTSLDRKFGAGHRLNIRGSQWGRTPVNSVVRH